MEMLTDAKPTVAVDPDVWKTVRTIEPDIEAIARYLQHQAVTPLDISNTHIMIDGLWPRSDSLDSMLAEYHNGTGRISLHAGPLMWATFDWPFRWNELNASEKFNYFLRHELSHLVDEKVHGIDFEEEKRQIDQQLGVPEINVRMLGGITLGMSRQVKELKREAYYRYPHEIRANEAAQRGTLDAIKVVPRVRDIAGNLL